MKIKIQGSPSNPSSHASFDAKHPMFRYEVPVLSSEIKKLFDEHENFVVMGLGGSSLPLKAFVDAYQLQDRIHFMDTVDPLRWKAVRHLPKTLFCLVSKSGETLEIKAMLSEFLASKSLDQLLIVTDPTKGLLRKFADENKLPTLEIPPDIGGRFTNFTALHRALLERFGIGFDSLLKKARMTSEQFKRTPALLESLYQQLFESTKKTLIIFAYGERLAGLAYWAQQAIAESLGKRTAGGGRVGIFPIVLKGPQDQHSVLQLLTEGPQTNVLWFWIPKEKFESRPHELGEKYKDFSGYDLRMTLDVLAEATFKTFEERLSSSETLQPLTRFSFDNFEDDVIETIVTIQALVEYSGQKLKINAFDQPGVERGKQIAREILEKWR